MVKLPATSYYSPSDAKRVRSRRPPAHSPQLSPQHFRHTDESLRWRFLRSGYCHRLTLVSAFPNRGVDGNFPEEWHLLSFRLGPAASMTENLHAFAAGRDVVTHVLHDAE